jgi:hypothetical protein
MRTGWQKCRHGPIKEIQVLCLGISCGIMASQATRITAYGIWGDKRNPGLGGKEFENYFVQFACDRWEIFLVPEQKYFRHPKIIY